MKLKLLVTALLALITPPLIADVEVFNHPLRAGASYTVPVGKTLILQSAILKSVSSGSVALRIQIPGASFAFTYSITTINFEPQNNSQALYLKDGATITANGTDYVLIGRLATSNELYASTNPSSTSESSSGSTIVTASTDSTRPVRFSFQESSDLINWIRTEVRNTSTSRGNATVEVDGDRKRKFVCASAKNIPIDEQG